MTNDDEEAIIERPLGPPDKLSGFDFYRETLRESRLIVAPMVDQSELQWRLLSRNYGAELCYTPMIHSRIFMENFNDRKRTVLGKCRSFMLQSPADRPLIAQFCGNDPQVLLKAVLAYTSIVHVDAVDLNLGCPQGIAKRGNYGAFLMDDWATIANLISTLHRQLSVPVTAKIRIFENVEKTVDYARMVESAGAQLVCVHGRTRVMKGCITGIADWKYIKAVKDALKVPVFANGNILYYRDVENCIKETGCDGVMTAEGNLFNPAIFAPALATPVLDTLGKYCQVPAFCDQVLLSMRHKHLQEHPPAHLVTLQYLDICTELESTGHSLHDLGFSAIRGHIFKMLHQVLLFYPDMRPRIGRATSLQEYTLVIRELGLLIENEVVNANDAAWSMDWLDPACENIQPVTAYGSQVSGGYWRVLPFWVLQPHIRPPIETTTHSHESQNPEVQKVVGEAEGKLEEKMAECKSTVHQKRKQKSENHANALTHRQAKAKRSKLAACEKDCGHVSSVSCRFGRCRACCLLEFRNGVKVIIGDKLADGEKLQLYHIQDNVSNEQLAILSCGTHTHKTWKMLEQQDNNKK